MDTYERDVMRRIGLLVLLFLVLAVPSVLHAEGHGKDADEVDRLAMYRPYAGKWESVTKTKVTGDEEPVEFENKGQWVQGEILAGAIIEMKGIEEMDGESYHYLWLYGYDLREESYVGWFHDQNGMNAKFYGSWSEEKQQMTWTVAETNEQQIFVTIVDDLSDPDRVGFTFKMEDADGKVIMTQDGYATRAKEE